MKQQLQQLKDSLLDLQNELIENAILENNIDNDYIYDYTEFDSRLTTIYDMINILEDLIEE